MEELKLNLGCGKQVLEGFVNIDALPLNEKVVKGDVRDLSMFETGTVDYILASDIIEHFPFCELDNGIIEEWVRVLRPGGKINIRCPDIEVICEMAYNQAKSGVITWSRLSAIINGTHKNEFSIHHVTFHFDWLKEVLEKYGMKDVVKVKRANMNMVVEAVKA